MKRIFYSIFFLALMSPFAALDAKATGTGEHGEGDQQASQAFAVDTVSANTTETGCEYILSSDEYKSTGSSAGSGGTPGQNTPGSAQGAGG